jgi:3-oxoacyl-[acyl-carrier protein] reductase
MDSLNWLNTACTFWPSIFCGIAISLVPAKLRILRADGNNAFAIKADVAVAEQMTSAISKTLDHYGRIDILVNNAGLFVGSSINDPNADIPALLRMWEVNVKGVVRTVRAIARQIQHGGGSLR